MLIVKVLQGDSPAVAEPIVVTSSPAVVRAVGEALARELCGDDGPRVLALLGSDVHGGGER